MKNSIVIIAGLSAFLGACSAEPIISESSAQDVASAGADPHAGHHMEPSEEAAREKRQFAEVFANHFDAQECESSELIGTMRRTEPDGAGLYVRSFQVPVACAEALKSVLETRGFDEPEAGSYVSEAVESTTERVVIRMADDGSRAGVEWEVDKE